MSSPTLGTRPMSQSAAGLGVERASTTARDRGLEVFLAERTSLFGIAFSITRDAPHAEDCVQDAWLRWQLTDRVAVINPSAFLATTVAHLAINFIQTATHRHETPSDSLPDEVVDRTGDPAECLERSAAVAETLRMLMARLSRAQLTAYVLRKGFDYSYADIARLLRTSIPNARQLIRRAQARIIEGDRDRPVGRSAHRVLLAAFLAAARLGDLSRLERVLTKGPSPMLPLAVPRREATTVGDA